MQRAAGDTNIIERAIFWAFIAGLAWCPFWFGSNALIAWGINAVIFPGLAFAFEATLLLTGRKHPIGIKMLRLPAALFLAVVIWVVIQNATWAPASANQPIWALAGETLKRPVLGSISANRDMTSLALLRLFTAASVFWLAVQLCRDGPRSRLLIGAIAAIVCAYAVFGLLSLVVMPHHTLWLESSTPRGAVSSTFINRNSFATYAGIGFLAIAGVLLRLYRHQVGHTPGSARMRIVSFIETTGRSGAAIMAATCVVLSALLLSGSRGGILSTAVAFFVLIVLTFMRNKRRATEQRDTILFVVLLAAAIFAGFGDQFVGKLANGAMSDQSRMAVYKITLGSILDSPVVGYGYGTFRDVFPIFRDQSISVLGTWNQAHNTYLEIVQGLGVFFGPALIGCVAIPVWLCLKGAMTRVENASLPALGASAGILVGLHALVDFSLQIQAVTLTFMAVLGAGLAQSESSRTVMND